MNKWLDRYESGGLVSKNSLNRNVTCSNCGWSWKLSDGGLDPMTCHKCGGDIKMREGGELDEYLDRGQVNFKDQLYQQNRPVVDATAAPIVLPGNLFYDKTRVVNGSSAGLNKFQLKEINQNLKNNAFREKQAEIENYKAAELFHNNNPVAKLLGTRSAPASNIKPTAKELAYGLGAGINEFYDVPGIGIANDFVNPLSLVSKGIISPWMQAPLQAQQSDSYLPYAGAALSTALTYPMVRPASIAAKTILNPANIYRGVLESKLLYNDIATGNSIIPYAWKSPAVNLEASTSQAMFDKVLNSRKFTDAEKAMVREYQYNSGYFTNPGIKQQQFNELIKKVNVEFPKEAVVTRRFFDPLAKDSGGDSLPDDYLNTVFESVEGQPSYIEKMSIQNRPSAFSVGVGHGAEANYGQNRIVLSGRNLKKVQSNFIKNNYEPVPEKYYKNLSKEELTVAEDSHPESNVADFYYGTSRKTPEQIRNIAESQYDRKTKDGNWLNRSKIKIEDYVGKPKPGTNTVYSKEEAEKIVRGHNESVDLYSNPENKEKSIQQLIEYFSNYGFSKNPKILDEREVIGSGFDMKTIGKVKNDIGGYDYIVKPINIQQQKNGGPIVTSRGQWLDKYKDRGQVRYTVPTSDNLQYQKPIVSNFIVDPLSGGYVHDPARAAALLNQPTNAGTISKTKDRSVGKQIYNVATNPMTSAQQLINKQPVTGLGPKNPYDFAFDAFPAIMAARQLPQIPGNIQNGEYLQAGLNALSVIPFLPKIPRGLPRVLSEGQPYEGAPHIYEDMVPINGRYQPRTVITDAGVKNEILGLEATPVIPLNQIEYPVTPNKFLYGPHSSFGKMEKGVVTDTYRGMPPGTNTYTSTLPSYTSFPNNNFKSEIDWSKWNKEIPENAPLIKEYNAIEQTSKANNTWMKNPDGSPFQGTPEQFVQQNSENFKKAFGNTKFKDEKGKPMILHHGHFTDRDFSSFLPSKRSGISNSGYEGDYSFFTPHKSLAEDYAGIGMVDDIPGYKSHVKSVYINSENPLLDARTEFADIDIPKSLREGRDAITRSLDPKEFSEVAVPYGNNVKSATGNNGMFDMTNPNIYKAVIPAAIGLGSLNQKQQGGQWLDEYKDRGEYRGQVPTSDVMQNRVPIGMQQIPTDPLTGQPLTREQISRFMPSFNTQQPVISQGTWKGNRTTKDNSFDPYSRIIEQDPQSEANVGKRMRKDFITKKVPAGVTAAAAIMAAPLAAPIVSSAMSAPLTIGSTILPYVTPATVIGAGFGLTGANKFANDLQSGYYLNPKISKSEKIFTGLTTGLDMLGTPGAVEAIGSHLIAPAYKGALKTGNYITRQTPTFNFNNNFNQKLNNTNRAISEHISGIKTGLFKDDRPFFEKFPITGFQKRKVYKAQDEALNEGVQFIDDWYYGGSQDLHPDIIKKMQEMDPNFKPGFLSDNTSRLIDKGAFGNPFLKTKNILVSTRKGALNKANISDEAKNYIIDTRGDIGGVNLKKTNESITLRNRGLYHVPPSKIKDIVIHEAGHTAQKLGKVNDLKFINWVNSPFDNIQTYDGDFTDYFFPRKYTDEGKLFDEAMTETIPHIKDSEGNIIHRGYRWESSPGELHSELLPARNKLINAYVKQGHDKKEAIDMLRSNPTDDQIDWMINANGLNRFFKETTTPELKRKVIRMLYAGIPATIGAEALNQKQQGGPVVTNRGQWDYPGQTTIIPSNNITMQGVPYPVVGVDNTGHTKMMHPGMDYTFPGQYVTEYPMMQPGGQIPTVQGNFKKQNEYGYMVTDEEALAKEAQRLNSKRVLTEGGSLIIFDDNWNIIAADDNPSAPYKQGGSVTLNAGGEQHRIYVKSTNRGEGDKGHIMVNHPTMDKGMWDTIDLTQKAGAKTIAQGVAATKEWHRENPYMKQRGGERNNNLKNINLNLPVIRHQEMNPLHFNGFLANDRNQNLFIGGINPRYQNEDFSVGPYMIGVGNKYFQKFPADMGMSGTYHVNDNFDINMGAGQNNINAGIKYNFANGGYVVRRSHDRKGKTHVVTGPDGTKKYFGDPNMGERGKSKYGKEAFYARHKSNLAKNPYFRAYARATWEEGGEIPLAQNGVEKNNQSYQIQKGDTLSNISTKYNVPLNTLANVNNIQNPNLIKTGNQLSIPKKFDRELKYEEIPTIDNKKIVIDNFSPHYDYIIEGDKTYYKTKSGKTWADISDNNSARTNLLNFINKNNYWGGYGSNEKEKYLNPNIKSSKTLPVYNIPMYDEIFNPKKKVVVTPIKKENNYDQKINPYTITPSDAKKSLYQGDISYGASPIQGYGVNVNTPFNMIDNAFNKIGNLYQTAVNGIKRKYATHTGNDNDFAIQESLIPKSLQQYYSQKIPGDITTIDVPDNSGRQYKQEILPVSNIKFGVRNRGEYKDINTEGLEITSFNPFNNKPLPNEASVLALDPNGNLHTGQYKDFKNNNGYLFSRTFKNNIVDFSESSGKNEYIDGAKSGNPKYKQPKVKVLNDQGKIIDGSLNILVKGDDKKDYYGSIQGGRILFVNPTTKEQYLVAGSVDHIKKKFKELKGDNKYLEAYTLDNGTYSRGLSYKDKKLTKDRLKAYDLENTSGGNGLYIVNYNQPINKYPENYLQTPNVRTTKDDSYKKGHALKNEIKNIVLHHTAYTNPLTNEEEVRKQYMSPGANTSHVVIQENGKRTIYASPEQVTFHAGESKWKNRDNVNDFSIGVEFQGDTNKQPLTQSQIESFIEYYTPIAKKYNLSVKDIITHQMIAPGRKPDITDKEYKKILNYMKSKGYKKQGGQIMATGGQSTLNPIVKKDNRNWLEFLKN